jgi:predicted AlkP superfamily pyrophosphatase or phosphodiesterase
MIRTADRPRLAVVISIDQFRADLLSRLMDQFLPPVQSDGSVGGFRYLMERGSYFIDAQHGHFPLETGPGHAVLLTGGYPSKTGIISNDWWDTETRRVIYCVSDPGQKVVGARAMSKVQPMGPLNLRSTTVGDELKLATGKQARVVSIAVKDRVSVLMGGHMQDVGIWYDETAGNWISSTAYCPDGKLPGWVDEVNRQEIPERTLGTEWKTTLPDSVLKRAIADKVPATPSFSIGDAFPHPIGRDRTPTNYKAFRLTPDANQYVFTTAKQAVNSERLGQDAVPDLLALGLAANDFAGHSFGPYSPEVFDVTVQTDRQLSDFLNFLRKAIPGGLDDVVVVITGDHGAMPVPESAQEQGLFAGRLFRRDIMKAAQDGLNAAFGADKWLSLRVDASNLDSTADDIEAGGYLDPYIYLSDATIARAIAAHRVTSRAEVEEAAARAIEKLPGIYACYTRTQVVNGMLPPVDIARHIANAFYPKISGDVIVVAEPYHHIFDRPGLYATSHGTPYSYDTHVPILIAGPGITSGVQTDRVSPADIAPTLSALLGIAYPSGCDGVLLKGALR